MGSCSSSRSNRHPRSDTHTHSICSEARPSSSLTVQTDTSSSSETRGSSGAASEHSRCDQRGNSLGRLCSHVGYRREWQPSRRAASCECGRGGAVVRGADPFECVGERSDVGVGEVLDKVAQPRCASVLSPPAAYAQVAPRSHGHERRDDRRRPATSRIPPHYAQTRMRRPPPHVHGKEGVDGSSPSEGFCKDAARRRVWVCVQSARRPLRAWMEPFMELSRREVRFGAVDPRRKGPAVLALALAAGTVRRLCGAVLRR